MFAASTRLALGYTSMLVRAVLRGHTLRRGAVRQALLRQIHVTGVQALPFVLILAVLFGAVVVTRVFAILGPDNEFAMHGLVWGGIREVGPLVPAFIIIARSSVAITAEVALMRLRAGIGEHLWEGVVREQEVVVPRVLGTAIASAMLVAYFQCAAIGAALVGTSMTLGTDLGVQVDHFLSATEWWQIPMAILRGALFGLGIGAIACYHGLNIRRQIAAIPKAVVATCVGSLVFVIALDALWVVAWL